MSEHKSAPALLAAAVIAAIPQALAEHCVELGIRACAPEQGHPFDEHSDKPVTVLATPAVASVGSGRGAGDMPPSRPLTLDPSVYYRDNSDAMRAALDTTMGRNAALYASVNTYVPPGPSPTRGIIGR
jgi:hypothetical protein